MRQFFAATLATAWLLGCTPAGPVAPMAAAPSAAAVAPAEGGDAGAVRSGSRSPQVADLSSPYCPANARRLDMTDLRSVLGGEAGEAAAAAVMTLLEAKPEASFVEVETAIRLAAALTVVPEENRTEPKRIADGLMANLNELSRDRESVEMLKSLLSEVDQTGRLSDPSLGRLIASRMQSPSGLREEEVSEALEKPKHPIFRGLKAGVKALQNQAPSTTVYDAIWGASLLPFVPGPFPSFEGMDSIVDGYWRSLERGCSEP